MELFRFIIQLLSWIFLYLDRNERLLGSGPLPDYRTLIWFSYYAFLLLHKWWCIIPVSSLCIWLDQGRWRASLLAWKHNLLLDRIIVLEWFELLFKFLLPLFCINFLVLVNIYSFHSFLLCLLLFVQDLPLSGNLRQDYIFLEFFFQLFICVSVALNWLYAF